MRNADARTVRLRQKPFNSNGKTRVMIWPLSTPNNLVVYGKKYKV